jgi:DNA-directed RNA polymerase specialized sigma subunit, sigma24 homolog
MQYRISHKKISELEEQLAALDEQADVQSQKMTGMPSGDVKNNFDCTIIEKTSVENEINSLSVIAREQFKNVLEVILRLNNSKQREVLKLYFLYGLTLEQIAEKLSLGYRTITRIYGQGVRGINVAF